MSTVETPKDVKLTALTDDGTANNYAEFALKAQFKFVELELWKYIVGAESDPPVIPKLKTQTRIEGEDSTGTATHIVIPGNAAEVEQARKDAVPWFKGNNKALSLIVTALPTSALHLARGESLAKVVWNRLQFTYKPRNTMRAASKMSDILGYRCEDGMNVNTWLTDMQVMYNELCDMDLDRLSDANFARTIVNSMPGNVEWRGFVSILRAEMLEAEKRAAAAIAAAKARGDEIGSDTASGMSSMTVIAKIRDEYWAQHKADPEYTSGIFSARVEANKKRTAPQGSAAGSSGAKRRSGVTCTNRFCDYKAGHTTENCLAYGGGKCGQYWASWTGPKDIHLPPHQRQPRKRPLAAPSTHQTLTDTGASHTVPDPESGPPSYSRADLATHTSDDNEVQMNLALSQEVPHFALHVAVDDDEEDVICSFKALDINRAKTNECFHDSGSNRHVFHSRSAFATYEPTGHITVKGFGSTLSTVAIGRGTVQLRGTMDGFPVTVALQRCLHVPDARFNLISQVRLDSVGVSTFMSGGRITLSKDGRKLVDGRVVNDMYRLNLTPIEQDIPLADRIDMKPLSDRISPMTALHQLNNSSIHGRSLRHAVKDFKHEDFDGTRTNCETCARANIRKLPFPQHSFTRATETCERIHTDVCGPLPESYGSFKYFITFIDDFSRYIFLYYLRTRDEAFDKFKHFQSLVERFTGHKVKILRVDNAPEYVKGALKTYCETNGIQYEKTTPESPSQNGVSERTNLTICAMSRSMQLDADISDWFWPFAVQAAVHIKNRVPHKALPPYTTPFQLWFDRKPTISHLRLFGSPVTCRILATNLSKFQARGESGKFMGYARDAKGYLIWFPAKRSILVRRDVVFHAMPTSLTPPINYGENARLWQEVFDDAWPEFQDPIAKSIVPATAPAPVEQLPLPVAPVEPVPVENTTPVESAPMELVTPAHVEHVPAYNLRSRPTQRSFRIEGATNDVHAMFDADDPTCLSSILDNVDKDTDVYLELDSLEHLSAAIAQLESFETTVNNPALSTEPIDDVHAKDPSSIREAEKSKYWNHWLAAMYEELESLKAMGVYEEVEDVPRGRHAVDCKWVLHLKRDSEFRIVRFKARLVAKGFSQIPGQDFTYTFAPVARWDSIRVILAIAALYDWELRHIDIKTAYLNGTLDEEIYMRKPPILGQGYWRLKRGLYGLRQAGRAWYRNLNENFTSMGFKRCESDWSVHVRRPETPKTVTITATSVDDIVATSDTLPESDTFANQVGSVYNTTDMGTKFNWLLHCHLCRNRPRRAIYIDQQRYIESILRDYGMLNANSALTPLPPKCRLTKDMCPKTDAEREAAAALPYCQVVGKVMYLVTCTRPDLAFAVRELAQFMSCYGVEHYKAVKHLLRYLSGTRSIGLLLGNVDDPYPLFHGLCDSDWATGESRKSISGYLIICAGGIICWTSKQQVIIAMSSCEAEFCSCAHCAKQVLWLRSLFEELGFPQPQATIIKCDNRGTISCTHDPHAHSRMKHIDIRRLFIRDCVEKRLIDVQYVQGSENPADLLTKSLPAPTHNKWRQMLRLDVDQGSVSKL